MPAPGPAFGGATLSPIEEPPPLGGSTMTRRSRRVVWTTALAITSLAPLALADASDNPKKIADAKAVFQELITSTDRAIPKQLLENAKCVAVIPGVMKAALGYGVRHGKGVMSCRTANGWSAPTF